MNAVVPFRAPELPRAAVRYLADLHAEAPTITWDQLPEGSRQRARLREVLMRRIEAIREAEQVSRTKAAKLLYARVKAGAELPDVLRVASQLARGNPCPDRSTLLRWAGDYADGGVLALADEYKGSKRKWWGWEPEALALWLTHNQPLPGTVAAWLQQAGWDTATKARVSAFIKSLPETLGKNARQRVGEHYHQQNIKPYHIRDYSKVPVGHTYEGDGHTCDFYVQHPLTGKHYRPELTVWIDWGSRYVAGWMLWDRESGLNTLFALSRAMLAHDHVPATLHVDPGSGFRNRLICHEVTGFLPRFGITPQFAIAGNARGKGLVEGFFRFFEERCGKRAQTYCGHDRTDDGLRRLEHKIKHKEVHVWTFEEASLNVRHFMEQDWNATPKTVLGGLSPAALWAELKRTPVVTPGEAVIRPRKQRTVNSWRVEISNRLFQHEALADFNKRDVIVEFDVFSWAHVWVYTLDGRFICEAYQVETTDAHSGSYLEDTNRKRLEGQIKREELAIEEKKARAGLTAEKTAQRLKDIEAMVDDQPQTRLEKETADAVTSAVRQQSGPIEIDIYGTDY